MEPTVVVDNAASQATVTSGEPAMETATSVGEEIQRIVTFAGSETATFAGTAKATFAGMENAGEQENVIFAGSEYGTFAGSETGTFAGL